MLLTDPEKIYSHRLPKNQLEYTNEIEYIDLLKMIKGLEI